MRCLRATDKLTESEDFSCYLEGACVSYHHQPWPFASASERLSHTAGKIRLDAKEVGYQAVVRQRDVLPALQASSAIGLQTATTASQCERHDPAEFLLLILSGIVFAQVFVQSMVHSATAWHSAVDFGLVSSSWAYSVMYGSTCRILSSEKTEVVIVSSRRPPPRRV